MIDNQPNIIQSSCSTSWPTATPMVRNPEKFGITIHKQEEYDLRWITTIR
ncbi:MAG: hypothetical protein U0361_04475 [Nitrospiraceae bacterium]